MKRKDTNAEAETAQAFRIATRTTFYVRSFDDDGKWRKHRLGEFETLAQAENYLSDCIRGNGVMALEKPVKAKFQIVKSVAEREVLKTWEGLLK